MSFTDTAGRTWNLRMTAGLATRIREEVQLSVLVIITKDGVAKWEGINLPHDPETFVRVLWLFVGADAEKKKVTRESFEDAFAEETYRQAAEAYYDAILSFSPTPAVLKNIFGTGEEIVRRMTEPTLNNDATRSPGTSESTPGTLRYAS